jgi:hypothetical protein
MSSVMMREKKGGEHKIWKGGKVILLLRWSDRLDGAADLSWPYRPYIYLHVYRPSIFIVSMYTHIKNKKKIQKKKLKRETIEIFFSGKDAEGPRKGPCISNIYWKTLFFLFLFFQFGPKCFMKGGARATPRRVRLLCTRSLAAKGQRDFCQGRGVKRDWRPVSRVVRKGGLW